MLRMSLPGISAADTLVKVAVVNALYFTNVFALVRVADHFAGVLARHDLANAGPELVEELARVPQGGSESRPKQRLSLAAKFAHFFVDEDRFPIYDKYAVRMVARLSNVPEAGLKQLHRVRRGLQRTGSKGRSCA